MSNTRPYITPVNMLYPTSIQPLTTTPVSTSDLPKNSPLASFVPSSGLLGSANTVTSLLGFNLQENLANVKEFGWNSWGASTNPAQELQKLQQIGVPKIKQKLASANASNMAEVLTWVDAYLTYTKIGAKHLMERHSRANSTREANRKVQAFCEELRSEYVTKIVNDLKSKGLIVTRVSHGMKLHEMESNPFNFRYFAHEPRLFDSEHVYNVSFNVYSLKDNPNNVESVLNGSSNSVGDGSSSIANIIKVVAAAAISRMIGII